MLMKYGISINKYTLENSLEKSNCINTPQEIMLSLESVKYITMYLNREPNHQGEYLLVVLLMKLMINF